MRRAKGVQDVEPEQPTGPNEILTWPLVPIKKVDINNTWYGWTSSCGRYRVERIESHLDKETRYGVQYKRIRRPVFLGDQSNELGRTEVWWDTCEYNPKMGSGYPAYYKTIKDALDAAEWFHCKRTQREDVKSNSRIVVKSAEESGLAKRSQSVPESVKSPPGSSNGLPIGPMPIPTMKTVGALPPKEKKERKAPPGPKTDRDRFNCQLGKEPSQINAVLSCKPQTLEEVSVACGLSIARVRSHLNYWFGKKTGLGPFLVKQGETWSILEK